MWYSPGFTLATTTLPTHTTQKATPPICSACEVPLTVECILINCNKFKQIRLKHYQTDNIKLPTPRLFQRIAKTVRRRSLWIVSSPISGFFKHNVGTERTDKQSTRKCMWWSRTEGHIGKPWQAYYPYLVLLPG